jgi:hypothetical protein
MNLQIALDHRAQVEQFRHKYRTGLVTLLFTDIVGSTKLILMHLFRFSAVHTYLHPRCESLSLSLALVDNYHPPHAENANSYHPMKRLLFALCLTVFVSPVLRAQNITSAELDKAIKYLEKTHAEVVKATKDLSEAQWNFKQAPDRWSVAEVTEHIASAEDFLMEMIQEKVMKAPARTEADDVKALDELVLKQIPDRSNKVQAPEPLRPNNRFGSPKDSLKHFKESRDKTVAFLKKTKDLRQHAVDSPLGKKLDGYQWVLFIAAHSERHTKQIDEVMADAKFPKK